MASGPIGLVAGTFQPQLPLVFDRLGLGFQMRDGFEGNGQLRWFDDG
jgi:hypothetical protein